MSDTEIDTWGIALQNILKDPELLGKMYGPNETGEVKSTVAQNLVSQIGTFNRENFTRLAKDTDFTQLIGFARANDTSGAIARALIAKLDSLELAQLGEATSSTDFAKLLRKTHEVGEIVNCESLARKLSRLKDDRLVEVFQNSDLTELLSFVHDQISKDLSLEITNRVIGLSDTQFAQAIQNTDFYKLLDELKRQGNDQARSAIQDKLGKIDNDNLAQAAKSTNLHGLAFTLIFDEKKNLVGEFFGKVNELGTADKAEAVQSTDVGDLLIWLRDCGFEGLATSILEHISRMNIEHLQAALKSTADGSMTKASVELRLDDVADIFRRWNPIMPNGFSDARDALFAHRSEVAARTQEIGKQLGK